MRLRGAIAGLALLGAAASRLPAQGLPASVAALVPSYERALESYEDAKREAGLAEADSLPQIQEVSALKAQEAGWLHDLRLRRALGRLQESLDAWSARRTALDKAKQDLFLQLSALEEELRASLEKELGRGPRASGARIRAWFSAKRLWDQKLEELGATDSRPFPMVEVPLEGPSPQVRADRQQALEARGIQLEAWAEMLDSDLRLWKRARAGGFVDAAAAAARIRDLEGLGQRVALLLKQNEAQPLSKN